MNCPLHGATGNFSFVSRTQPTMEEDGMSPRSIASPATTRRIVLLGGGHANVQVLKGLVQALTPDDGVHVTLVSDYPLAFYSGMLPGCVARLYPEGAIAMDLPALCAWGGGVEWIQARVTGVRMVDAGQGGAPGVPGAGPAGYVVCEGGREIGFHVACVNLGSITRGADVPGVREWALTTRPISELMGKIRRFEERHGLAVARDGGVDSHGNDGDHAVTGQHVVDDDDAAAVAAATVDGVDASPPHERIIRVVVIGGGAAGIELAMAFKCRWTMHPPHIDRCDVHLVDSKDALLSHDHRWFSRNVNKALADKGVHVWLDRRCEQVHEKHVELDDGQAIAFDLLVWASGASAPLALQGFQGVSLSERGFLRVNHHLQSVSHPSIFGAGDCVSIEGAPWVPKAGVYAVREGPILCSNVLAAVRSNATPHLHTYTPQRSFLKLLMTGDGRAVSSWKGFSVYGSSMWWLKDRIDRGFMQLFHAPSLDASVVTYRGGRKWVERDSEGDEVIDVVQADAQ